MKFWKNKIIILTLFGVSLLFPQLFFMLERYYVARYYKGGVWLVLIAYFAFWISGVLFGILTRRKSDNEKNKKKLSNSVLIVLSFILLLLPVCDIIQYSNGYGILFSFSLTECILLCSGFLLSCNKSTLHSIVKSFVCIVYSCFIPLLSILLKSIEITSYSVIYVLLTHIFYCVLGAIFGIFTKGDNADSLYNFILIFIILGLTVLSVLVDLKIIVTDIFVDRLHVIDVLLGYGVIRSIHVFQTSFYKRGNTHNEKTALTYNE